VIGRSDGEQRIVNDALATRSGWKP